LGGREHRVRGGNNNDDEERRTEKQQRISCAKWRTLREAVVQGEEGPKRGLAEEL